MLLGKYLHCTPAPSPLLWERPDNGSREQPPALVLPAHHAHSWDPAMLSTEEQGKTAEA